MLNATEFDNLLSQTTSDPQAATAPHLESEAGELYDLWQPEDELAPPAQVEFEDRLLARGALTSEQVQQARAIRNKTPRKRIGEILLEMGAVKEADLLACVAEQYELPFLRLTAEMVDPQAAELLDREFVGTHSVLPLNFDGEKLVLATTDPANVFLLDEIERKVKRPLSVVVCTAADIKAILESLNTSVAETYAVDDIIKDMEDDDLKVVETQEDEIADVEREASESPVIKFVNYIIFNATKEGASDIHIEPGHKKLKIRYRIDGVLFESFAPPHTMHSAVVSRIKIMANMDIAERRLPQDGRIRVMIHGRKVDMRVSTIPSSHGEKVVIRILDMSRAQMTLQNLGLEEDQLEILNHQTKQPHGMILVTGPTGSGKSTTLYAALCGMNTQSLNVSTVEDPVEYQLDGVTQVQVQEHIGMTFSAALRALLRQDPDVIMVGEIRDEETARIAVQASLTGHLVFSTLHTNDAPSSITRLINIGIESYLIAASTNAVLAQRLVRRICDNCREPYTMQANEAAYMQMYGLGDQNTFHGKGCDHCRHTGYQGRVGLYELLTVDDTYRDIITNSPAVTDLRRFCKERGMVTLREDGLQKVQAGQTTFDEVMRVTESTI